MKRINTEIYRLLDANMNRAMEGIRVLEDTARMLFNDANLTKQLKNIRHSIVHILHEEKDLTRLMLFARDSEHDVLRSGKTPSEKTRADIVSIVRANSSRSQEAVRALEEYVKLSFPSLSEKFKKIRFELYDIEKSLIAMIHLQNLINESRLGLYVVLDRDRINGNDISEITDACLDGGAGTVSYRDKRSNDSDFLKNAERMLSGCSGREVTSIIENRLDIALILHADGLCVEYGDVTVKDCRTIAGKSFVIVSCIHFDMNVPYQTDEKADYYIVGPVFKNNGVDESKNLKALEDFISRTNVPVLAFGGITQDNIKTVLDRGAAGVSLNPDFSRSAKIGLELQKFNEIIETYRTNFPTP